MITTHNLTKSYGEDVLFEDFSAAINRTERIGLIGPNGSGKSTLFSIILEKVEPSSGSINIQKGLRMGHLPQEARFESQRTVLEEVVEGDETIIKLKKEKQGLEARNHTDTKHYGDVLHQLEFLGFFDLEHKAKKILMGLGFKETDFTRPITQMSGGWQMRALLAKLLTCHYDILLLDEPTNFLDLGAVLWFKDFLAGFRGTFIMISHDKDFLDEVTNYSFVLEDGIITRVKGSYEDYQKIKHQKQSHLLKQFTDQQRKTKQLKEFISRFHAQPNKAAQVRAKRRMLEKMQEVVVPQDRRQSIRSFSFPQVQRSGYRVVALKKISKSYDDIRVYHEFDFEITKGEKAVLVGQNGAGKSTLLKILAGVIDIDGGQRIVGHNTQIGYSSQTRMDVLNPDNTVLDEAYFAAKRGVSQEAARTILGLFLFSGDDVDKKVKVLSGGEKSRLILAKLLINPPNFLLLDEPTTHLDIDAVDALIKALKEYQGSLVFISHDIHFVRSVASSVFEVKSGGVRRFSGSLDYYLQKKDEPQAEARAEVPQAEARAEVPQAEARALVRKPEVSKAKVPKTRPKKSASGGLASRVKQDKQYPEIQDEEAVISDEELQDHNFPLAKKVRQLRKRKEDLQIKRYAHQRILSSSHHDQNIKNKHRSKLDELDQKMIEIDDEIRYIKTMFL